jgi:PAS domain S-box-containing protein
MAESAILDRRRAARIAPLVATARIAAAVYAVGSARLIMPTPRDIAHPAAGKLPKSFWDSSLVRKSVRYGGAALAVAAAAGLRWLLRETVDPNRLFITFYPTIALVAMIAGGGPGVLATALSTIIVAMWMGDDSSVIGMEIAIGLFAASGLIISAMAESLHRAQIRAAEALRALLAERSGDLRQANARLIEEMERRQQAQETLRESESRLRLFIEYAPAALAMFDRDMRYLAASRRWLQDYGLGAESPIGQSHYDLFPEIPERWKSVHRRALAGEVIRDEDDSFERQDGEVQWIQWEVRPWYAASGAVGGIVIFAEEVTQRKRAELALRESRARLWAVLNTAADAIITINRGGLIDSVNPATERMFGYSQQELLGQNVRILMPPPYCDEHDEYLRRFAETREPRIIGIGREVLGRHKDGSTFSIDLAVSETDDQGFTGIIRDISERKQLQKHILEVAAEEQRRIGQELHDGTGQELTGLTLLAGTLDTLLGGASRNHSHDQAAWLLGDDEYQRVRQIAARLLRGLNDANRHVNQLSHGIMPVQIDAQGLRAALEELAATINGQQNISCRFDGPASVEVASNTTATQLYRIAQEALNNALRHGRADYIRISLEQQGGQVMLKVMDNGVGFDRAARQQKSPARGMGLRTMEYRAGLIGGTLHVVRMAQGGTSVICAAPRGVA